MFCSVRNTPTALKTLSKHSVPSNVTDNSSLHVDLIINCFPQYFYNNMVATSGSDKGMGCLVISVGTRNTNVKDTVSQIICSILLSFNTDNTPGKNVVNVHLEYLKTSRIPSKLILYYTMCF